MDMSKTGWLIDRQQGTELEAVEGGWMIGDRFIPDMHEEGKRFYEESTIELTEYDEMF
jgi:hypothetical protein